jgi:hypothetical protein
MNDSDFLARLTKIMERWDRDGLPEARAAKPSPEICPCGKGRLNTITFIGGQTVKVCAPDDGVCGKEAAKPKAKTFTFEQEGEEFVIRIPVSAKCACLFAMEYPPVPGAYMPVALIREGEYIKIPEELRCRLLQVV